MTAETGSVRQATTACTPLQWSRGLLTAETQRGNHHDRPPVQASMEPRSFDRGDITKARHHCLADRASMEPRSFDRGDAATMRHHAELARLQWSRGLLTAETRMDSCWLASDLDLQWSRGLLTAET